MTKPKLIELDLRRDLPLVRKQYGKVLAAFRTGSCNYTAPCVVGAMVPQRNRSRLQCEADSRIGVLIGKGLVCVPQGQRADFTRLQKAFDDGTQERFEAVLQRVEAKYLDEARS